MNMNIYTMQILFTKSFTILCLKHSCEVSFIKVIAGVKITINKMRYQYVFLKKKQLNKMKQQK